MGRTYLSEMEHDDSSFFSPKEDFPVMAGDSGRYWLTEEERRARTPASTRAEENDLSERALRQELRDLESIEPEEDLALYHEYRDRLPSVSERIFFLKLPPYERHDYLQGRGLVPERQSHFNLEERMFAVKKHDIILGMTKTDVLDSWGRPVRVEVAGNPRYENERWLYKMNGASKFIYFEAGQVQGWE